MQREFKVGDLVTCSKHGGGVVVDVEHDVNYPVLVRMKGGIMHTYTKDGREYVRALVTLTHLCPYYYRTF